MQGILAQNIKMRKPKNDKSSYIKSSDPLFPALTKLLRSPHFQVVTYSARKSRICIYRVALTMSIQDI